MLLPSWVCAAFTVALQSASSSALAQQAAGDSFCFLQVASTSALTQSSGECQQGCSSHGVCEDGFCTCDGAWVGQDCSFFLGAAESEREQHEQLSLSQAVSSTCESGCSQRGSCVAGVCLCQEGFYGPACADTACPQNCHGRGSCLQGQCLCHAGWSGLRCEMQIAPSLAAQESSEIVPGISLVDDASQMEAPAAQPAYENPGIGESSTYAQAHRAAAEVFQVADKLYAAAKRASERSAGLRMKRAIQTARNNAMKLPGHEFMHQAAAEEPRFLQGASSSNASSLACAMGCSGHGTCHTATGRCLCEESFIGEFCDTQRCPSDCSSGGVCLGGKCLCSPQFYGAGCELQRCPGDCSGHGYCFEGACQCSGDFGGEACLLQVRSSGVVRMQLSRRHKESSGESEAAVSTLRSVPNQMRKSPETDVSHSASLLDTQGEQCPRSCSNRGRCHMGTCLCFAGWQGHDCSITGACSGHGSLIQMRSSANAGGSSGAACSCDNGWSGENCGVQALCADATCSGHGNCRQGTCSCSEGYSGHSCHISLISMCETRCGSHGACSNPLENECECNDGWTGSRCDLEFLECPYNCHGHGTCVEGACSCHEAFEGESCLHRKTSRNDNTGSLVQQNASKRDASTKGTASPDQASNPEQDGLLSFLDANDRVSQPLTSAWMKPAVWISPATLPKRAPEQQTDVSSQERRRDGAAEVEQLWHPALQPRTSSGTSSMLSLLKTGSQLSKHLQAIGSTWNEPSLEQMSRNVMGQEPLFATPPQFQKSRSQVGSDKTLADLDELLADV